MKTETKDWKKDIIGKMKKGEKYTTKELVELLGLSKATVISHLNKLVDKGLLKKESVEKEFAFTTDVDVYSRD